MSVLCLMVCVSCVCAYDVDSVDTDTLQLNPENTIGIGYDNGVDDVGGAKELDIDIRSLLPGDTYDFEKDFYLDDTPGNSRYYRGIVIETDNVTLNGNGHTIEGNFSAIFKVEGNNVKISNLTIKNTNTSRYANGLVSQYYRVSPINWMGDNGILSDCIFIDNAAVNGGSLRWAGNNGTIDYCQFINNIAEGVGGAIYVIDTNMTILNSYFENCSSLFSGDSIYLSPAVDNISLGNNSFKMKNINDSSIIAGKDTGINPDWFYERVYENVFDENVCLYEILYKSMLANRYIFSKVWTSEILYMNENVKYNIEYDGLNLYINFNKIIRDFDDKFNKVTDNPVAFGNLILGRSFYLENMTSMYDISLLLHEKKYVIEDTAVAEYTLTESADIGSVVSDISYDALKKYINPDSYEDSSFLNIFLPANHTYKTNGLGNLFGHLSKYTIVLQGNGSKIVGPYDNNEKKRWTGLKIDKKNIVVSINNLTIQGFNHGIIIEEDCTCNLFNVKLMDNKCDYSKEHDWGGGILNMGTCNCVNCSFINNYAKYGAGIYSQGILVIDNATSFINNKAYKSGNDVTYVDSAIIIFNGTEYKGHGVDLEFVNGTYFMDYQKGFTSAGVNALLAESIIASFTGGFITGVIIGDPWIGLLVGGVEGLIIGAVNTIVVLTNNYDYHRNNVNTALLFIGTSMAAGMVGGFLGGLLGSKIKSGGTEINEERIEISEDVAEGNSYETDKKIKCNNMKNLRTTTDWPMDDEDYPALRFANGEKVDIRNAYGIEGSSLLSNPDILVDETTGILYSRDGYGIVPKNINLPVAADIAPDLTGPI